jgi:non-specific serine/threonine protein kinase
MSDRIVPEVTLPTPGEAAPGLELRLFGPLEVRIGSRPLPRLHSRKGLWLLALLALRAGAGCPPGRGIEREWLAGTLWPECDAAQCRRNLRQSLHDLRRSLGPEAGRLIDAAPRALRLELQGAWVDVLAFDDAIGRADLLSLEAAVQLYRGPLLEACVEEWCLEERRQREEAYVAALARLAEAAMARREPALAARYLRRAVGADPYREELQGALMEALAAGGNPTGALLVYRRFRDLLRRDVAAEPAAETTALFERLRDRARQRAPSSASSSSLPADCPPFRGQPARPNNLPVELTSFIGREAETAAVQQRLATAPLLTLTGPGGSGKTRLARHVAARLLAEYPEGVWFVDLAPLADPSLVAQTVAAVLGVREEPGRPLTETLIEFLRPKALLLLLDNCEHLVEAGAPLAQALLLACPGLRILATSREALGVAGEQPFPVPPLSLPGLGVRCWGLGVGEGVRSVRTPNPQHPSPSTEHATPNPQRPTPDTLLQYEAVRLFAERATLSQPRFTLCAANGAAVAEICCRLDGIPLAIELAAARLKVLSVEQIAARLDDVFRLLTGGSRTALPRHQTLRATMDWSYDLLSPPERVLLRRLSVFAGGWTLEAAEAVGVGDGIEEWEVLDLLTSLVGKSLILYEERGGEGRYRLLETVRQYARERLLDSAETAAVWDRHLAWAAMLAERAGPELRGPRQGEWLERLEREHDNLRAALRWPGAPGQAEAGLRLCGALWLFWDVRGYWTEGREHLARLLALPGAEARTAARAEALSGAGVLAWLQNDWGAARALHEESLTIFRELGDKQGVANSLRLLGEVARDQGDWGAARALLEDGLAIFRELGNKWGIAWSLRALGWVAFEQGDCGAARALLEQSLAIHRDLGDKWGIAWSLRALGWVAFEQGDCGAARAFSEEGLPLFRALGNKEGAAGTLMNLGGVAREQGDYPVARSLFEECLAIFRELGQREGIVRGLGGLAVVAAAHGQPERAARLFGAAEGLREGIGAPLPRADRAEHRSITAVRAALGEEAFAAAWAEGRAMGLPQAVEYAMEPEETAASE